MSQKQTCHVEAVDNPVDERALRTASVAYLNVYGMGCERCALRVRNGLLRLDGVILTDVFLEHATAAVAFDPRHVREDQLLEAVLASGSDSRHRYQAVVTVTKPVAEALSYQAGVRGWA